MILARALSLLLLVPALAPASAQQPPQQPPAAQQAPAAQQGGAPDDRVAALEARVAALEQKVQALTVQGGERERMAEQAAAEIAQLAGAGKMTEAKAKLDEFMGLYASTGAAQRLGRLRDELGVEFIKNNPMGGEHHGTIGNYHPETSYLLHLWPRNILPHRIK